MRLHKVLNNWQLVCFHAHSLDYYPHGHLLFIGLVKLKSFPVPYALITRKNYRRFLLELSTWPRGVERRRGYFWFFEVEYPVGWKLFKLSTWITIL